MNVLVRVSRRKVGDQVLLKPANSLNNHNLAGAKCMVKLHEPKSTANMSIINPTNESVFISADTVVATVFDVGINELYPLTDEVDKNGLPSACCSNINIPAQDKTNISFGLSKSDLTDEQKETMPMSFQMVMSQVLRSLSWKHMLCYIDGILVFSRTFDDRLYHLNQVFQRLREAKLTRKPEKFHFALIKVVYLGHNISKAGIEVDPSNTEAVRTFPVPKNQRDVRSFLGLSNFYWTPASYKGKFICTHTVSG